MVFLLPSPTPPSPGLAKDHKKYVFFFRHPSLSGFIRSISNLPIFSSNYSNFFKHFQTDLQISFRQSLVKNSWWSTRPGVVRICMDTLMLMVWMFLRFKIQVVGLPACSQAPICSFQSDKNVIAGVKHPGDHIKHRWKNVQVLQIYLCYFFGAVLIFWLYMRKQTKTLCYYHCAKSNMLKLLCYQHCYQ